MAEKKICSTSDCNTELWNKMSYTPYCGYGKGFSFFNDSYKALQNCFRIGLINGEIFCCSLIMENRSLWFTLL